MHPMTLMLLFSLALHLAFILIFQPAGRVEPRDAVVIEAHLLPMKASPPAPIILAAAPPNSVLTPQQTTPTPTPSPTPLPDSIAAPIQIQPVPALATHPQLPEPTSLPEPTNTALPTPAPHQQRAQAVPSQAEPINTHYTPSKVTDLPSLPIEFDANWYSARQVDVHPKAIGKVEPIYPEEAKRRNQQGSLLLLLKIDEKGRVWSAEVVVATPPEVFNEAALAAFREARFTPAMRDGRPVRYLAHMRVEFTLQD